jgi:RNA polymerase sigma-70 factor (ECF subfamily)
MDMDNVPVLADDPGERLEQHRPYLKLLARLYLNRRLQAKIDASDVVQQSFLEAQRGLELFRGRTAAEFAAWLRQILACQVARCLRDLHREKRDASKERSLQAALDHSSQRLEAFLAAKAPSPSQCAQQNERSVRVAAALEALLEDQREALILHYYQGITVSLVAERMGKTPAAVAGLLQRGLKALRGLLAEPE